MHETLLERPRTHHENQLNDLARRRYFDAATDAAEVLDGVMHSQIPLGYDGDDIYSKNDGTRFGRMMQASLDAAHDIVTKNPELAFELERRQLEAEELPLMLQMMTGGKENTMIVISDFPQELQNATQDLGGYNVRRRQTMLRVITAHPDGNLNLVTQSLDGSNRAALEAIYHRFGIQPQEGQLLGQRIHVQLDAESQQMLSGELTAVYDASLSKQFGGDWYAGRPGSLQQNTLDFVYSQTRLLHDYISSDLYDDPRGRRGFMQLMTEAYELSQNIVTFNNKYDSEQLFSEGIQHAILQAINRADREGRVFSGCGGTSKADASDSDFFNAGYGNADSLEVLSGTDKYGPLDFNCPKGHKNTRPRNELMECCKVCGVSVRC